MSTVFVFVLALLNGGILFGLMRQFNPTIDHLAGGGSVPVAMSAYTYSAIGLGMVGLVLGLGVALLAFAAWTFRVRGRPVSLSCRWLVRTWLAAQVLIVVVLSSGAAATPLHGWAAVHWSQAGVLTIFCYCFLAAYLAWMRRERRLEGARALAAVGEEG